MIQDKELRIGNWYNQFGNFCQATGLTIYELSKSTETQLWCKSIAITAEILEKCGFEKMPTEPQMYIKVTGKGWKGNYKIRFSKKQGVWLFKNAGGKFIRIDSINNPTPLFYLHQLQNLYFALTGEELNIKL
jgi:hypothetical protein